MACPTLLSTRPLRFRQALTWSSKRGREQVPLLLLGARFLLSPVAAALPVAMMHPLVLPLFRRRRDLHGSEGSHFEPRSLLKPDPGA